ncbi:acyl carrier protein [Agrobacterium rhizogenes]|uniref:acyl carrier protein n=1 Tax=Rhizobium rhizogenes TaxID=359 RepID=UPI001572B303|nr:acyl carrier protein [Rhizobium rhizogenes]NTG51722.1 acyl carrier protein [Rhizobium rhizogenes]
MSQDQIFETIVRHTREVLPDLDAYVFKATDSLRELGANSIDRADIIMMTLESLSLDFPLIEIAGAQSIGELAGIIHAKS